MLRVSLVIAICLSVVVPLSAAEKPKTIETEIVVYEMALSAEEADRLREETSNEIDHKALLPRAERQQELKTRYRLRLSSPAGQSVSAYIPTPVPDDFPDEKIWLDELRVGFSVDLSSEITTEGIVSKIEAEDLKSVEWDETAQPMIRSLTTSRINTTVSAIDGERVVLGGLFSKGDDGKDYAVLFTLRPRIVVK